MFAIPDNLNEQDIPLILELMDSVFDMIIKWLNIFPTFENILNEKLL
jgi:hypothetical protein